MPSSILPVLWICGAPGVGKSVTAWSLFQALGDDGVTVAYIDTDQLGMLYPDGGEDPDGYRVKTDALNALLPNYAAAGVQVLIVSGVVAPESPVDLSARYPQADLTFCLLNPDLVTLRARILERDDGTDADEVVAEAVALTDAAFPHTRINSAGMSVLEVVAQARTLIEMRAANPSTGRTRMEWSTKGGVVVITGPRAVGTSSVGFGLVRRAWRRGVRTGFADLDQLSFLRTGGVAHHFNAELGAQNVAAVHAVFESWGASHLVVSSHLADQSECELLRSVLGQAPSMIIRLRADEAALTAHVVERTRGAGPRLAGDDLNKASPEHQRRIVKGALRHQRALDQHGGEDALIDVGSRTTDSVVDDVTSWLSGLKGLNF